MREGVSQRLLVVGLVAFALALGVVSLAGGSGAANTSTAARAPFLDRCPKQFSKKVLDALRTSYPRGVPVPRLDRARLCGIPAARSKSKPASTLEATGTAPPRGVSLTKIKSATRAAVERVESEVARCYRRAGKRIGPPDDSRIQPATDSVLRNQRVRDAAQRLRTNALAERTDTQAIAQADLALDALVPQSYRRLISDFARDGNLVVPSRRIACTDSPPPVVKPDETVPVEVGWVELHSVTKGDDASYNHYVDMAKPVLPYIDVGADVGWDSEATSTAIIEGVLVVPEGTKKVTITAAYTTAPWLHDSWGNWGTSCAETFSEFGATRLNGGYDRYFGLDSDICGMDGPFPDDGHTPVPDAPGLSIETTKTGTLQNPPPGVYAIWIEVGATAYAEGMASAYAWHFFWLDDWTAKFDFE